MRGRRIEDPSASPGNGNMKREKPAHGGRSRAGAGAASSVEISCYSVMQNEFIIGVRGGHGWDFRSACDERPE